ncbi:hypothetical protein F4680DRAFT_132921 [Xylaria scruposa]|nr:hypothetical protein F4680DRAFT_132921 [Xylaria scruposa]
MILYMIFNLHSPTTKMKHLLLALLATSATCTRTVVEIQGQEAPSSTNIIAVVKADSPSTTTLPARHSEGAPRIPAPAPVAKRFQARQHTVAARTTSAVITSTTTFPTPTPTPVATGSDGDETSDTNSEDAPSSTVTITITSNRTTTIRPTVTVTSLFSSVDTTTSGASGRLEPWIFVDKLIQILLLIFSVYVFWD